MSKGANWTTGRPNYDGTLVTTFNSTRMTLATGADSNNGSQVAPCDLRIVDGWVTALTLPTATAAALNVGTPTDSDAFIDGFILATDMEAGASLTLSTSVFVNDKINKGDVVEFELEGNATAGGEFVVTLVALPYHATTLV